MFIPTNLLSSIYQATRFRILFTATRQWILPVSDLDDGRVPSHMRLIDEQEPALLDILEIP